MKGYLQELDTVNFNPDLYTGMLPGLYREAKICTTLYNIIYQVTLSPNQVLDSAWIRESYSTVNPKSWPFIFTVHESVVKEEYPFLSQLLLLLRRSGDQSFIFSSLPRNVELAQKWGEFMLTDGINLSDEALLEEANNYVGEIIDWAKQLDSVYNNIVVHPFGQGPHFKELYMDYLTGIGVPYLEPPKERSEAYSKIASLQKIDSISQFDTLRSVPDLVSNVQYAINTQSRLILSSDSILEHKIDLPGTKGFIADIVLDLKGLLSEYTEIEEAIVASNPSEIAIATNKARKHVQEGWDFVAEGEFAKARRKFGDGLKSFVKELVQQEIPSLPISISFEPAVIPGQPPTFKVEIPFVNPAVYYRWFMKWKLRGLDKFINIRKRGS